MKRSNLLLLALLVSLYLFAGIATAATVEVAVKDFKFVPEKMTVKVGDTVKWTNNGSSEHTVTSGGKCNEDKKWDSGGMKTGQTFEYTFKEAGTFPYFCKPHCHYGMKGEIIVQ